MVAVRPGGVDRAEQPHPGGVDAVAELFEGAGEVEQLGILERGQVDFGERIEGGVEPLDQRRRTGLRAVGGGGLGGCAAGLRGRLVASLRFEAMPVYVHMF